MTDAGLKKIREAKASGEWKNAILREDVEKIPVELERALRRKKGALARYRALPDSRKKRFLWWFHSAKSDAARKQRVGKIVDELSGKAADTHGSPTVMSNGKERES